MHALLPSQQLLAAANLPGDYFDQPCAPTAAPAYSARSGGSGNARLTKPACKRQTERWSAPSAVGNCMARSCISSLNHVHQAAGTADEDL